MEYSEMGKTLRIQMIDLFIYPDLVKRETCHFYWLGV